MPKIYESPDGGLTVRARDIDAPLSSTITITDGGYPNFTKKKTDPYDHYSGQLERCELCKKYPELEAKWREYVDLAEEYQAWDLLHD